MAGLGSRGDWRMLPTAANGQPAAAAYLRGADGVYRAYAIVVLTATTIGIARLVVYGDTELSRSSASLRFCRPRLRPRPRAKPG